MHRVYADFTYKSGVHHDQHQGRRPAGRTCAGSARTSRTSWSPALRSLGLAGRYVSGYLATRPPPGKPRLVGADASHAWVGFWVPGTGWLYLDPTNNRPIAETHATVACGRDYGDVPPVKGVIFTEAKKSTMKVTVDMAPR